MIRSAEPNDVEEIASLYRRVIRLGTPEAILAEWFRTALFDSPFADPEVPSLVASASGGITGFLGSYPRPLLIDGEKGRLACSGHLVVDPAARRQATGAILLRTYLSGPQDLTITDGATDELRAIWTGLGGRALFPQCVEWHKPLRPGSFAAAVLARRRGRDRPGRIGTVAGRAADRIAAALPAPSGLRRQRRSGEFAVEPLDPSSRGAARSLAQLFSQRSRRVRLLADYSDPLALEWLLGRLAAVRSRGELRIRLIRERGGRVAGAFIYYLVRAGLSSTIAVLAEEEESAGLVLDALLEDADENGAASVRGRLEPRLVGPAAARGCFLRYVGEALGHARDPRPLSLLGSPGCGLTRLDGEWWMDPHMLSGSSAPPG